MSWQFHRGTKTCIRLVDDVLRLELRRRCALVSMPIATGVTSVWQARRVGLREPATNAVACASRRTSPAPTANGGPALHCRVQFRGAEAASATRYGAALEAPPP